MVISERFRAAVKLNRLRSYEIAQRAGVSPCVLSRIINRIDPVKPQDHRVEKIAIVLGIPLEECFSPEDHRECAQS
jgi:transcriptional regulator with XRE-family HTH domain